MTSFISQTGGCLGPKTALEFSGEERNPFPLQISKSGIQHVFCHMCKKLWRKCTLYNSGLWKILFEPNFGLDSKGSGIKINISIHQNNLTWMWYTLCFQVFVAVVQMMVIFWILCHIIKLYPGISEAVGWNIFSKSVWSNFSTWHKTLKMTIIWTQSSFQIVNITIIFKFNTGTLKYIYECICF